MLSEEYTEISVCGVQLHSAPSGLRIKRFRRGISPALSPPAHEGYWVSPGSPAQHVFGAKAEKGQITWTSDPQVSCFSWCLQKGQARRVQTEENRLPKPPSHFPFLSNSRVREKLSFLQNKTKKNPSLGLKTKVPFSNSSFLLKANPSLQKMLLLE